MEVAVIGAGASGLMCACEAAKRGASVTVYEKNEKAGKKLYITGKGRCNVTNNVSPDDFLPAVVSNPAFLMGAIHSFTPTDMCVFLEDGGCPIVTERGGRVFPASGKASDVTKCLVRACEDAGVKFRYGANVDKILLRDGRLHGVSVNGEDICCDKVAVCTGGKTYPLTGSTGDGYFFAESLGHSVVAPRPALCGVNISGDFCRKMQGLTLKNVTLTAYTDGKIFKSLFGELLFSHYGVTGPIALTMSSYLSRLDVSRVKLVLDFKPALSDEILDKRLLRDFAENQNKDLGNVLTLLLPKAAVTPVLERARISPAKKVNSVSRTERGALLSAVKRFEMTPKSLRGFDEAVITSGGVNVREINPKTMESKLVPGVYFCGEVLDVDACTGGYNLQIAFSTGHACGAHINDF
ncbi:MAG: NAD(P)/FAD-dependent oxidoreductase [Clostridia bacterium]|nr:NAD(P)/FAD-dependent oxidoreductase [Clostridia bacterium]